MRFLFKSAVYVFAFLFLVGLFTDPDDSPTKDEPASTTPIARVSTPSEPTLALLEPEKSEVILDQNGSNTVFLPDIVTRASAPSVTLGLPTFVEPKITPSSPASGPPKFQYVTGSVVNVRAGPSAGDAVVAKVKRTEKVRLIGPIENKWQRIEILQGGRQGWMAARFLADELPTKPKLAGTNASPTRGVAAPTTGEIARTKKAIIQQSIASYPGSCPCPYNRNRAGRRCGKNSAWSRPNGYAPMCYESDISAERVATQLARIRGASN